MTTIGPTPTGLLDALHAIHRQDELAGVLASTVAGGAPAGMPCHLACLLRDTGTHGWYVTALSDAARRPTAFDRLGIPGGPFAFTPPPAPARFGHAVDL